MQGQAFLGPKADESRRYIYAIRDRMAERFDTVRVVRDKQFQYVRNFQPHRSWSQFTSYTEEMPTMKVWRARAEAGQLNAIQARYFQPAKPVEELYDTAADPHQVHNLADDPWYGEVLERMRRECRNWMLRTHDLGLLSEYELERRSEGRTPWDTAHDAQANPLERLLPAANAANRMDPANIPALLELLRAADPAVRFWAATGLAALGEKARPATEQLLAAAKDDSPEVQVLAAEALANVGRLPDALPVLIAALQHDSAVIRLRALNVLDQLGQDARPALPAIRQAKPQSKVTSKTTSAAWSSTCQRSSHRRPLTP